MNDKMRIIAAASGSGKRAAEPYAAAGAKPAIGGRLRRRHRKGLRCMKPAFDIEA